MELPRYPATEWPPDRRFVSQHWVWFATKKRLRNPCKLAPYDDRGTLEITPSQLTFSGKEHSFHCRNIQGYSLIWQTPSWLALLLVNIFVAPIYLGIYIELGAIGALSVAVVFNAFSLWSAFLRRWVRVEYIGENQLLQSVFFSDGQFNGWGGVLGETKTLLKRMNEIRGIDDRSNSS